MDSKIGHWQRGLALLGMLLALVVWAPTAVADSRVIQRPIQEFVAAQGTYCLDDGSGGCLLFVPPVANFIGWTDLKADPDRCMSADYAGLADKWIKEASGGAVSFGTETSGSITERLLPDGRAEVTVRLHTKNALIWVNTDEGCWNYAADPLLFGHRAPEVLAGADPALGETFLQLEFINPAPGDPMPDLLQLFIEPKEHQEGPSYVFFNARADGTLREAFGVPDGTPGRVETIQSGHMTPGGGATADGYPAEHITLNAVGRNTPAQ